MLKEIKPDTKEVNFSELKVGDWFLLKGCSSRVYQKMSITRTSSCNYNACSINDSSDGETLSPHTYYISYELMTSGAIVIPINLENVTIEFKRQSEEKS